MKKGIIFDMDGTLWDSSEQVAASWDCALEKQGYRRDSITIEEMQGLMGKTMDVIADTLFPQVSKEEREELLAACCEEENAYLRKNGGVLYPNVQSTMEQLAGTYHLYIVSNCQSGYMEAFLDYYKLWNLVEDIECYGNNGKQKGENIALLCQRNGLEEAVYVGDIQGDYEASCQAGIKFIHAAYGFGTIDVPVPKVDSFAELLKAVPEVFEEIG